MAVEWYYAVDREKHGPITAKELKRLADSQKIRPGDLVWKTGLNEWVPAKSVVGLFDTAGAPTPINRGGAENVEKPIHIQVLNSPPGNALSPETPEAIAEVGSTERGKNYFEKDPTNLTAYLKVMLVVYLLLNIISLCQDFGKLNYLQSGNITKAGLESIFDRNAFVGLCSFLAYMVTGILFLMWIHRANLNIRGFGAIDLKYTPGWSVGYYFIPIMNLFKPYQAMREIWKASKNPANWKSESGSGLLRLWWGLWLASCFLNHISFKASMRADSLKAHLTATYNSITCEIIDIPLTVVAIVLIGKVYAMQKTFVGGEIILQNNQQSHRSPSSGEINGFKKGQKWQIPG
jgi:hypothetical protein